MARRPVLPGALFFTMIPIVMAADPRIEYTLSMPRPETVIVVDGLLLR
jgi:hypothetical protein